MTFCLARQVVEPVGAEYRVRILKMSSLVCPPVRGSGRDVNMPVIAQRRPMRWPIGSVEPIMAHLQGGDQKVTFRWSRDSDYSRQRKVSLG